MVCEIKPIFFLGLQNELGIKSSSLFILFIFYFFFANTSQARAHYQIRFSVQV